MQNNRANTKCFVAGTLVLCEEGYKKIEDIQVGERVLVHNENCGNTITVDSYDEALQMAEKHLGGQHYNYRGNESIWVSNVDSTKVVRFDVGNTPHVLREGPHLNLETYSKPFGTPGGKAVYNLHVFWR